MQMSEIRFDGRVAIVTGAGGGLGRTYALELARRGARVVVNDKGGAADGTGSGSSMADAVVKEIREAGGSAVASYDSVSTPEGGSAIVKTAVDAFGRVDVVINNAGILRDKTFAKLEPENLEVVLDVHLKGAFFVSQPAFRLMKEQGYGRFLFTASNAGIFGNFGQTNYGAAKMGLVGLSNVLALEGAKNGITSNVLAPMARTRLTESLLGAAAANRCSVPRPPPSSRSASPRCPSTWCPRTASSPTRSSRRAADASHASSWAWHPAGRRRRVPWWTPKRCATTSSRSATRRATSFQAASPTR
jgi:NAD(P)-dependent dehydrogenase (short-subunit alcohol dehydrogenase family)